MSKIIYFTLVQLIRGWEILYQKKILDLELRTTFGQEGSRMVYGSLRLPVVVVLAVLLEARTPGCNRSCIAIRRRTDQNPRT